MEMLNGGKTNAFCKYGLLNNAKSLNISKITAVFLVVIINRPNLSVKTSRSVMKYRSQIKSMPLDLFTPDLDQLPKDNRWVKHGDSLPWDQIEMLYNSKLNNGKRGAGNKPASMIIGALLIKHKMNLSDEETIEAIRENPYMQYMLGLKEFTNKSVFDPSLFVTIRKRIGSDDFNDMSESLLKLQIERLANSKGQESENQDDTHEGGSASGSVTVSGSTLSNSTQVGQSSDTHRGTLKIDATCSDAEVRYPTDLDLLHDGCEVMERIIDRFCDITGMGRPSTDFKAVHAVYLKIIKKKNKTRKELKRCTEYLLSMLSKSTRTALSLFGRTTTDMFMQLKRSDRKLFMTIMKMYHQQQSMYDEGVHHCEDRIISIFQPHVRPIVRGKSKAKVEFGSKIGVSVVDGYTFIDHFSWDAYNKSEDLMPHLRAYKKRFGCQPELVDAGKIYLNRRIMKLLHIKVGSKPLGRPSKTDAEKEEYEALMARYSGERNEVEGASGTGKRVYRANNIRAKLADTGESWCGACYFAKNMMKFLKGLLHFLYELADYLRNWIDEIVKSVTLTDYRQLCAYTVKV